MRKLKSTRLQSANDTERPANNNILGIFASNFRLEAIGHVGVVKAFNALRHRSLENKVDGVLVVARWQNLRLAFARISESPGLLVEYTFSPRLSTASGSTRRQMPTNQARLVVILVASGD